MTFAPEMTPEETAFLAAGLTLQSRVWEWGSGASTLWLAQRVKHVTAVEHRADWACRVLPWAPANVSLIYHPPEHPYEEGSEDDGDLETFRSYVHAYTGDMVDVVIIDGRARLWCARQAAENAAFGPHEGMKFYLHDCQRPGLRRIFEDDPKLWGEGWFRPIERVGNLLLMGMRT